VPGDELMLVIQPFRSLFPAARTSVLGICPCYRTLVNAMNSLGFVCLFVNFDAQSHSDLLVLLASTDSSFSDFMLPAHLCPSLLSRDLSRFLSRLLLHGLLPSLVPVLVPTLYLSVLYFVHVVLSSPVPPTSARISLGISVASVRYRRRRPVVLSLPLRAALHRFTACR
jgi:hypothetical protein